MGKVVSKIMKKLSADGPKRILMLGLDNAGKTTILYRMKRAEDFNTVPTIGFNVETISPCRGVSLTVWDVGGQDHLRTLWHHYFDNVDGLVFVIDSTDCRRLSLSKAELNGIYQHESMKNVPLIIIANKQDSKEALSAEVLAEKLDLIHWPNDSYFIIPCCALTGAGLTDAFKCLAKMIRKRNKNHRLETI
ncbi:unnamed protein product [Rotaria magnacalcarata]|uniref:ADP-ribosylation factor-like protein n=1 Tax=Rotaria magnacalcarata TaxID=392030 RepID=A0A816MQ20_9BILA|nr:unnamed protein product [Rotaria magnacalcarata]CAF1612984.1 unnamed protein product [Rotaria magnacalcarata]CAF2006457.1 unnamed protein product [Rotaria magnacalcarata]CAF2100080.1 unnamed protein product [Rotaria magnacalcarata]CAF2108622.1 unnamed protein product [Rotaria magnacalcarata]